MVVNSTNTQRIEQLEQGLTELRAAIPSEVETAVEKAMVVFQQAIATQVAGSLDKAMEKLGEEFSQLTERLEGRISRARGDHEQMIGDNRRNLDKFQEEIRQALSKNEGEVPESSRAGGKDPERGGEIGSDEVSTWKKRREILRRNTHLEMIMG